LCYQKFDAAVELLKEPNYNYKGGRQCNLTMQIRGVNVALNGGGTNKKVYEFYEQFKHQIEEVLNEEI
jgi:hypothetical protein